MLKVKVCQWCRKEKLEEEFSWKDKSNGIRQSGCKQCHSDYSRQHYKTNKAKYISKARRNQFSNRAKLRVLVRGYLSEHGCIDCGETDPTVLEFDHVRGSKRSPVSQLVNAGLSVDKVCEEILKCEVRCCNCHKRKTSQQLGYWYT